MEIRVKVIPGAPRESVEEKPDGRYLVAVSAKAEEGRANERMCELLARYFGVTLRQVVLIKGHVSPTKTVIIANAS